MSIRPHDLMIYAGGEVLELYGTLVKRTAPGEEGNVETYTRTGGNRIYSVDGSGKLIRSAAEIPGVDWIANQAGSRSAYLTLVGAATNDWQWSEDEGVTYWNSVNSSWSADLIAAPDGATTADKLVEDATASVAHYTSRGGLTATASTLQAFMVFVKEAGRTQLGLRYTDKAAASQTAWFNLTGAGSKGTTAAAWNHTLIKALADGWYMITGAVDSGTGGSTPSMFFEMSAGSENRIYNGDGSSGMYIWGRQVELDTPAIGRYISSIGATNGNQNAETFTIPYPFAMRLDITIYLRFFDVGTAKTDSGRLFQIGTTTSGASPRLLGFGWAGGYGIQVDITGASASKVTGVIGAAYDTVELAFEFHGATDGSVGVKSRVNGAAVVDHGMAASPPEDDFSSPAWASPTVLSLHSVGATNPAGAAWRAVKVVRGLGHSMDDLLAAG